jgi:hypothetical protein
MSTGPRIPDKLTVKTEYEHGRLVRQVTMERIGGNVNVTEVRCTCDSPKVGCSLHGKKPA